MCRECLILCIISLLKKILHNPCLRCADEVKARNIYTRKIVKMIKIAKNQMKSPCFWQRTGISCVLILSLHEDRYRRRLHCADIIRNHDFYTKPYCRQYSRLRYLSVMLSAVFSAPLSASLNEYICAISAPGNTSVS